MKTIRKLSAIALLMLPPALAGAQGLPQGVDPGSHPYFVVLDQHCPADPRRPAALARHWAQMIDMMHEVAPMLNKRARDDPANAASMATALQDMERVEKEGYPAAKLAPYNKLFDGASPNEMEKFCAMFMDQIEASIFLNEKMRAMLPKLSAGDGNSSPRERTAP